jgi:hypothetical protein
VDAATVETEIGPRQAATAAAEYAATLLPDAKGFRLEEIELEPEVDAQHWLGTLSLGRPRLFPQLSEVLEAPVRGDGSFERQYKSFKVDVSTGKVVGMTIRHVEGD